MKLLRLPFCIIGRIMEIVVPPQQSPYPAFMTNEEIDTSL